MSFWDNFDPQNPYKKAEEASQKGYDEAQAFQQPITDQGQEQYDPLNQARENLMDPATLQNKWADDYSTTPYAQQQLKENQAQGMDAASAMGLQGSSAALQNVQTGAGNIMQKDRQQYMNDLMQKYLSGIGIGENLYGVGATAAGQQANRAQQQSEEMAKLEAGKAMAIPSAIGKVGGMVLDAGANYATGGGFSAMQNAMKGVSKGLGSNSMNQ